MSMGLNASQARAKSHQDLIIFNECTAIMQEIITVSATGAYELTIANKTDMTTTMPTATVIGTAPVLGTIVSPAINPGDTVIIQGTTVVLGTSGTNLNCVIADINDANIAGVTASKDENSHLVLTILTDPATWTYEIGAGTANADLGLTAGVASVPSPVSKTYWETWAGTTVDRAKQQQMDAVVQYFVNLGYKVDRITNADTGRTFNWYIYW